MLWLKVKFAELMVWLGVDWPNIPDGDKLNAITSIGLGFIGIGLGVLGYRLTRRQAEIAEIQHTLMQEQLARKAKLSLHCERTTDGRGPCYQLVLLNSGNKVAMGVSAILVYPEAFDAHFTIQVSSGAVRSIEVRPWGPAVVLSEFFNEHLFVERPRIIAKIRLTDEQFKQSVWLSWKLTCEDGTFPPADSAERLGRIELKDVA